MSADASFSQLVKPRSRLTFRSSVTCLAMASARRSRAAREPSGGCADPSERQRPRGGGRSLCCGDPAYGARVLRWLVALAGHARCARFRCDFGAGGHAKLTGEGSIPFRLSNEGPERNFCLASPAFRLRCGLRSMHAQHMHFRDWARSWPWWVAAPSIHLFAGRARMRKPSETPGSIAFSTVRW